MEPDIEEILEAGTPLVFAADQAPFDHFNKETQVADTFCPMVPLMTIDGRVFGNVAKSFPKRSRVWWMLLPRNRRELVVPGAVWSGEIEHAKRADKDDAYQLRRDSVEFGAKGWIEVIDVDEDEPDLAVVQAGTAVRLARPASSRVILRGRTKILGPFSTVWQAEARGSEGSVVLKPVNQGKPDAWTADAGVLGPDLREFRFTANQYDLPAGIRTVKLALVHERVLAALQKKGRRVDAATDAQIVNWGLGLANFTGREKASFKQALDRVPLGAADADRQFPGRMERFKRLCDDAERVAALGQDSAEVVAAQPAFRTLVDAHVENLAATRVEALVEERRSQVDREVHAIEAQRDRVKKEIAKLDETFAREKQDQEARLVAEHGAWLANLDSREVAAAAREKALDQRQQLLETRLERLIEEYRERGEEVGDAVLAQLPILRRVGLGGATQSAATEPAARSAWRLPTYLERPVPKEGLTEPAFLDQLARVAAHQGYVFHRDDLAALHVALKVGLWTVVAGPSGIGKSSLPRLYAEALGANDEFLSIPVRPDWMDDRDVVGGFNVLSARYEPAPTGLVDQLIAAHEDLARGRGGFYVIVLDEMNLARVEHYFAQFLSILAEPPTRRVLTLFSHGVERPDDPYSRYRRLPIGGNVRFVGTVNVDETTHFFSPKVLDRFAVATLEPPDLAKRESATGAPKEVSVTPVHWDEYRAWVRTAAEAPDGVRKLVLAVDHDLRLVRSGLGFRSFDRVLAFVASSKDLLATDRALDLALEQTMLPRLRADHPAAGEAIRRLSEKLPAERFARTGTRLAQMASGEGDGDYFQQL